MTAHTHSVTTVHEQAPVEGSRCGDPKCGHTVGRGHPRNGWVRVSVAGVETPALWYSSYECLAYATAVRPALVGRTLIWAANRQQFTITEAVTLMNRYSGFVLTVLGLTPVRVAYAYRAAVARLDMTHPEYDNVRMMLGAARSVLLADCRADDNGPADPRDEADRAEPDEF